MYHRECTPETYHNVQKLEQNRSHAYSIDPVLVDMWHIVCFCVVVGVLGVNNLRVVKMWCCFLFLSKKIWYIVEFLAIFRGGWGKAPMLRTSAYFGHMIYSTLKILS